MRIIVESDDQPLVDMWGTERKAALFERVFKRKVEVKWNGDAETTSRPN